MAEKESEKIWPKYENGVWKGNKVPIPDEYLKYGERLLAIMKNNSALVGQIDAITGKEDTFGEMADRCVRCALWLKKQDIKPGDVVGLSTENHLNAVVPIVSTLFLGAIINPWWELIIQEEQIHHVIDLTKAKIIFASETNARIIQKISKKMTIQLKIVVFGYIEGIESFDEILADQDPKEVNIFKCTEIKSLEEPALILFTSGSTGRPKGVLKPYRSLVLRKNVCPKKLMHGLPGMTFCGISWVLGITNALFAIELGAKMVIFYGLSVPEKIKLINKFQVSWIYITTLNVYLMESDPLFRKQDFSSLKFLFYGGARIPLKIHQFVVKTFPNVPIYYSYGATESGLTILCRELQHPLESCGTVTDNNEVKVMNEDGSEVLGPGITGEIWIKSLQMFLGYINDPKNTAEVLQSDGWYRSGDVGYYTEDGAFYITERIKDLIKIRFIHLSPMPIENLIMNHSEIQEVAVIGRNFGTGEEKPMAFVVKRQGMDVTADEIIQLVKTNLPQRFSLSGGVHFLENLPKTANGKINKSALRQMASQIPDD